MHMQGEVKPRWFGNIFELKTDFFALLKVQADKTLEGIKALEEWLERGVNDRCQTVKDLEKEADVLRLELAQKLFESFITPFDREDIYDLSVCLDEVINSAKSTVREMEAFEVSPDHQYLKDMASVLVEGTQHLTNSFASLGSNLGVAVAEAQLARKSDNKLTKMYRNAIRDLFTLDDVKTILRIKEVYKSMLATADHIDTVGEKLLHAIVKMG